MGAVTGLDEAATDLLTRVTAAASAAPRQAAGFPHAQRTAIAAVPLLAGRDGEAPVRTLARLAVTVKNKAVRSRVHTALTRLGALRVVTERGAGTRRRRPRARPGRDPPDPRRPVRGDGAVEGEKARLTFARGDVGLKGVPAALKETHADELKQLRDSVKAINATLTAERQRVEALLSEERTWAYPDWVSRFLDHPVTGTYGRRLLWETSADGCDWSAGLPRDDADGWVIVGLDGRPVRGGRVRLWHPVRAGMDEALAWRDRCSSRA